MFTTAHCAALLIAAIPCVAPGAPPAPATQQAELGRLRQRAMSADAAGALAAIAEMEALGEPARASLREVLEALLKRSGAALEMAVRQAAPTERMEKLEAELAAVRKDALANVERLNKGDETVPQAMAYYKKLVVLARPVSAALAGRARLLEAVELRFALVAAARRAGLPAGDEAAQRALLDRAGAALGAKLAGPEDLAGVRKAPPAAAAALCRLNRDIAAWNRRGGGAMHREEYANAFQLNDYRELLGLSRLEIDERLVQAARQHSKEMVDLKYFAHDSPVKEHKGFAERIRQAGYAAPGGENIALGPRTGAEAFWQWFASPPHHKNMVRAGFTAVGVGKWGKLWTQNFGRGKPLVRASEAEQKAVRPAGRLLPPGP